MITMKMKDVTIQVPQCEPQPESTFYWARRRYATDGARHLPLVMVPKPSGGWKLNDIARVRVK